MLGSSWPGAPPMSSVQCGRCLVASWALSFERRHHVRSPDWLMDAIWCNGDHLHFVQFAFCAGFWGCDLSKLQRISLVLCACYTSTNIRALAQYLNCVLHAPNSCSFPGIVGQSLSLERDCEIVDNRQVPLTLALDSCLTSGHWWHRSASYEIALCSFCMLNVDRRDLGVMRCVFQQASRSFLYKNHRSILIVICLAILPSSIDKEVGNAGYVVLSLDRTLTQRVRPSRFK